MLVLLRKAIPPVSLALILLTAGLVPFIPLQKAYSPIPETETFSIPVQKDSFLKQGSQAHNEGANTILDIKSSDKHRPVMAFDTNAINNAVNGRQLQSAILRLYVTENGNNWGPDGNTIGAHRLLSDWEEGNGWNMGNNIAGIGTGVTWGCAIDEDISNNQDNCAVQWDGGSFQSPATANALVTNNFVNQWVEFNVTSDVQAFLDGTANYGWLIKKTSESLNGAAEFASKEAAGNNPVLQITVPTLEAHHRDQYRGMIAELNQVSSTLGQTDITQDLIDEIDANLTKLQQTVVDLQNLGLEGEITTHRVDGKMVGSIKFYDVDTLELFFQNDIPEDTLGIFSVMGLRNEYSERGVNFSFDHMRGLLNSSFGIAETVTTFQDDAIASNFTVASMQSFHPSTGNSILPAIRYAIIIGLISCIQIPECEAALFFVMTEGEQKAFEFAMPKAHIDGIKFNDFSGEGIQDTGEPGLGGWNFTMSASVEGFYFKSFEDTTDASGIFDFGTHYFPRIVTEFVIFETPQDGWQVTTEGPEPGIPGESQIIVFEYPPVADIGQTAEPFETSGIKFGNRLISPAAVFEENFDGGASGWSESLCQRGGGQQCLVGTIASPEPAPSPPNWGMSAINDSDRNSCFGPIASKHAKTFDVPAGGNYEVSSWMWGASCDVCNIFARLFVDGVQIFAKGGQNRQFDPPQEPSLLTAVIPLSAGQHTVEIGMTSNLACNGLFRGEFDDITIKGTAASPTGPLAGGPYHHLELNQTSANVTKPGSATVELEVEWYDPAWPAQPVQIVLGNMTGTGIAYTVESMYNTTEYQTFEITFDVTADVQAGEYAIPIIVRDLEDGYVEQDIFLLRVE